MKLKKYIKFKFVLLFLILFSFLYKINPIKNFSEIISYKLPKRLENIYGYCGGESIGYLKYIKNGYAFWPGWTERRVLIDRGDFNPKNFQKRGCQLSLTVKYGKRIFTRVSEQGVVCDWREPNVIRVAPHPLYNSYLDGYDFVKILF